MDNLLFETDLYKLFGVPETATVKQINTEYWKKIVEFHPDKDPRNKKGAAEVLSLLKEAYEILGTESTKAEYDTIRKRIERERFLDDWREKEDRFSVIIFMLMLIFVRSRVWQRVEHIGTNIRCRIEQSLIGSTKNTENKHTKLDDIDLYELFEVDETATIEQIEAAYWLRVLEVHPDQNPDDTEAARKKFAQLGKALEVLGNEIRRDNYDTKRNQRGVCLERLEFLEDWKRRDGGFSVVRFMICDSLFSRTRWTNGWKIGVTILLLILCCLFSSLFFIIYYVAPYHDAEGYLVRNTFGMSHV